MEEKNLICINCPLGCPLTVTLEGGEVKTVSGNTCPRGEAYARKELTNPTRIVTSTVKVKGGSLAMASVKTASDIPKGKIFDCVKAIQDIELPAPVTIGQVVLADVCGTGVDIVATKNVPAKG
nr:DUF1667 domain-containing protein [uncultured Oscillibacter sp.]